MEPRCAEQDLAQEPPHRRSSLELVYNLFAVCLLGSPNTHAGLCVLDPGKQTFHVMRMIAVALVVKAALTIVTFSIKVPAGIFIPTLGVGACAGRIVGLVVQYARWRWPTAPVFTSCLEDSPCVIPGLYAMVGAAAALSGVTRTTVSLAVIMFELTDTLTYAIPVMLAVLVAKTVADALEPKGIYDLVIELSQLPYLNAKHQYLWGGLTVSDAMDRDVEAIHFGHSNTVCTLRDQLAKVAAAGYGYRVPYPAQQRGWEVTHAWFYRW
ncbi:chloride channel [Lactifluus subvellereus]|nr:chloride channel [Lactifluus subvellereus]